MESHDPRHPSHQATPRGVKERWYKCFSPLEHQLFHVEHRSLRLHVTLDQSERSFACLSLFSHERIACHFHLDLLRDVLPVHHRCVFLLSLLQSFRSVAGQLSELLPGPWKTLVGRRQRRHENSCKNPGAGVPPHTPCKTPIHHRTERPAAPVALAMKKSRTVSGAPFLPSPLVTAVPHQVPHELIFWHRTAVHAHVHDRERPFWSK